MIWENKSFGSFREMEADARVYHSITGKGVSIVDHAFK